MPSRPEDLAEWLPATVLDPSHALFREDEYLLREDPRVTAEAPYYSLLQAIAGGRASQGRIAQAVGRAPGDIVYHLNVMTTAGFLVRDEHLLTPGGPRTGSPTRSCASTTSSPDGTGRCSKTAAPPRCGPAPATFRSRIVGPHLEWSCAMRWVDRYAARPRRWEGQLAQPAGSR